MLAGAFGAPAIIRRAGPVQAFAALAASTAIAALVFPTVDHWVVWAALRAVIGFAFAGLYAVIEAWLNARSNNSNRGRVYALYQIVNFAGSAVGQEMLTLSRPQADALFSLAAACLVLAIIPLALSKAAPPRAPRSVSLRLGWFARMSPVGAVAALCIGAANGSFFSLAPVYGVGLGLSTAHVAAFMTAVTIGTALAVYPVARLSDGHDRRLVLLIFTGIGVLAESMLAMGGGLSTLLLSCLGLAVGGSTMVLYTVAISHANDRAGPENGIEVSAGMLFLYCIGAIVMPAVGVAADGQVRALHAVRAECPRPTRFSRPFVLWRLLMGDARRLAAQTPPADGQARLSVCAPPARNRAVRVRRVTNSSAAVGCTAMVASKSAFLAPICTAMAMSWIISPASCPRIWTPSTRSVAPSTTIFMIVRSVRPDSVALIGRKAVR